MADFTALKTAIQNAIKQNGNEEITGNLLQEVLLAIVTTLGDGSIDDLITALNSEATTRSQADGTLQQNINAEAQARQLADSTLQGGINTAMQAINAINNAITNGCVYAGIATPSSTPASGKVFYLALTAGTYTNYGGLEVSQGINILKNNGSAWSLDAFVGIDDAPTPSSNNLVKSGGAFDFVMTNGSAFDLSAYNNGTTYANLNAALTALSALPAAYKKSGMSMKFVLTSDNKYVQYRLMADEFSTTPSDWQGVDDEAIVDSINLISSGGVDKLSAQIDDEIYNLKKDTIGLSAIPSTDITSLYTNKVNGKKYNSSLELINDSSYYAQEIPVKDYIGCTIKFYTYAPNGYYGFKMYDGTIQDVTTSSTSNPVPYNKRKSLVVPMGAKTLCINYTLDSSWLSQQITIEREKIVGILETLGNNIIIKNIVGINRVDFSKVVSGTLDVTNGNLDTEHPEYWISDFIDLSEANGYVSIYNCSGLIPHYASTPWVKYVFYNENKEYISGARDATGTQPLSNARLTIPSGAKYLRCNIGTYGMVVFDKPNDSYKAWVPYQEEITQLPKKWANKKILVLGDSISDNNFYMNDVGRFQKWPDMLRYSIGVIPTTDALHASGFVVNAGTPTSGPRSLVNRIENHYGETYDMIILFMGVNDAINNIPIGTQPTETEVIDDSNKTDSFYNAVEYCFRYIINNFTDSRFVCLLPLYTTANYAPNLANYVEALKNECERYNVQFLNLYKQGGFRTNNTTFLNMFSPSDGLHPNKEWDNNYLTPQIVDFINKFI